MTCWSDLAGQQPRSVSALSSIVRSASRTRSRSWGHPRRPGLLHVIPVQLVPVRNVPCRPSTRERCSAASPPRRHDHHGAGALLGRHPPASRPPRGHRATPSSTTEEPSLELGSGQRPQHRPSDATVPPHPHGVERLLHLGEGPQAAHRPVMAERRAPRLRPPRPWSTSPTRQAVIRTRSTPRRPLRSLIGRTPCRPECCFRAM